MRYLSHESISTYRGNVLPLMLLGGETEFNLDKITWSTDNKKVVQITSYAKDYNYGGEFTNGVLLTFLEVGEATVTAKYGKKAYSCKIKVREMRHAEPSKDLQYFVGDLHDHTWNKHKLAEFSQRDPELYQKNHYMKIMKNDGRMDFGAVSDHSGVLNARDFFRGYSHAEEYEDSVVFFPGSEGQVTIREKDRYGVEHMHGGEVLTFNADLAFTTNSWDKFFAKLKHSPFAFCGYPHPQIIGYSVKGVWDFRHRENNSPRFKNLFRFVEMGDGSNRSSNLINEYVYSVALDEGFHVSPTCSSDGHGPGHWGYDKFPGKTVIMAQEKSKEAFHDAILHNRMYASSTGNVKLYYSVNGKTAPATLENEGEYRFHVETSYFRMGEPDTHVKKCKVISDRGVSVVELENMGDVFDFTVTAPDSHYFYLCLMDEKGRKTWSCPVWTGKSFEKKKEKALTPIPKETLTVYDRISKSEIPALINDDPLQPWVSEQQSADLIFDLGKETELCAVSHYPFWINRLADTEKGREDVVIKKYPSKYRISVSCDGESFKPVAAGYFRVFGWEETVRFAKQKARYLRLEILSSVGKEWGREDTADGTLTVAELTLWK